MQRYHETTRLRAAEAIIELLRTATRSQAGTMPPTYHRIVVRNAI